MLYGFEKAYAITEWSISPIVKHTTKLEKVTGLLNVIIPHNVNTASFLRQLE